MNLKPDKECEKHSDIVFLSEIITNTIYWQGDMQLELCQIQGKFRAYH